MVARLAPVAGSIAARAIVWSVISLSLEATGATPRERASRPGAEQGSTCAEAPRPAHDRIDGRSPGSRVGARRRLPGEDPSGLAWARRLQLRGQLRHKNLRS